MSPVSTAADPLRLKDPFVRVIAQGVVLSFLLLLISPAIFAVALYYWTEGFRGTLPTWADFCVSILHNLSLFPSQLLQLIVVAMPILLAQVCYRHEPPAYLNLVGRLALVIAFLGTTIALFSLLLIDPQDTNAAANVSGGATTLTEIKATCEQVARSSITYGLIFFGLQPRSSEAK